MLVHGQLQHSQENFKFLPQSNHKAMCLQMQAISHTHQSQNFSKIPILYMKQRKIYINTLSFILAFMEKSFLTLWAFFWACKLCLTGRIRTVVDNAWIQTH